MIAASAKKRSAVSPAKDRTIRYTPFASQLRFHQIGERFKGFSGPVGSGKSLALCQECLKLAYINAGRTGMITAPTYKMLHTVTRAAFLEILATNELPYTQNKGEDYVVLGDTGSVIYFRSAEDPLSLIGANLAWFGCDELSYTLENAWERLEARLRDPKATQLQACAAWTPNGLNWVYRRFFSDDRVKGYEAVRANPFENVAVLSKTPDFYDRLKASYDPRFFQQEVLGEYLSLFGGTVYHSFDDANLRDVEFQPDLGHLCWSLDFNVNPMTAVIAQLKRDPRGNAYALNVIDEIVLPQAKTRDMVEEFISRTAKYREQMGWHRLRIQLYGDPAGNTMHTSAVSTDYEIVDQIFARQTEMDLISYVGTSAPLVKDRVNTVNGLLFNAAGQRHLWVNPRCYELKRDFREVRWKADKSGNLTATLDKSDPKRTHISDALGYLVWTEFGAQVQMKLGNSVPW